MITALERFIQFISADGTLSEQATLKIEEMTRQINQNTVLSGSGSPEGVIEAEPTTVYMDTAGTAGNILYVKKTGAGDTGWILV